MYHACTEEVAAMKPAMFLILLLLFVGTLVTLVKVLGAKKSIRSKDAGEDTGPSERPLP